MLSCLFAPIPPTRLKARATLVAVLFCFSSATDAGADWRQLFYPEHSLSLSFPTHAFDPASASNDGRSVVFYSPDRRSELSVASVLLQTGETPGQVLRRTANEGVANFTYKRSTNTFFVASGYWKDIVFYRRCNFVTGRTRAPCFELRYPASEKQRWDAVVIRMSRSLRFADAR